MRAGSVWSAGLRDQTEWKVLAHTGDARVQDLTRRSFRGGGGRGLTIPVSGAAWGEVGAPRRWAERGAGGGAGTGGRSWGRGGSWARVGGRHSPARSGAFSWMEACLKEELPPPVELEEGLRNGVLLAKLGHCFAPAVVPLKKIYDVEQLRYQVGRGLSLLPASSCLPFSLATRDSC